MQFFSFRRCPRRPAEMFEHTMSTVLIIVSVGVVGVVLAVAALWFRSEQSADMGSVSHTWVAELRAGEPYDSNR